MVELQAEAQEALLSHPARKISVKSISNYNNSCRCTLLTADFRLTVS